MSTYIRASQRAPTACIRCAKKRIKCDKQIPCNNCAARGLEGSCAREVVRVKGQIVSPRQQDAGPTYSQLQEENRRLKAELGRSIRMKSPEAQSNTSTESVIEIFEAQVNSPFYAVQPYSVHELSDIYLPSAYCSRALLEHGCIWTSWIHFAIHIPTFTREHDECWEQIGQKPLLDHDPLWLAIYFGFISMSLLFMDTKEAAAADLPRQKTTLLIQNWYDAALFFLHQGDFLRKHDMRSVQVIAILLGLFKNVGDFGLQPTLMAAGIRIAQCLGMDKEPPTVSTDPIDQEVSRRIWWTLIICEWLQRPARPYCIQESDFAVNLPFNLDDEEILDPQLRAHPTGARDRPRPVQYHNAMIALSQLYYRFSSRAKCIGHNSEKLESLVLQTDEALANLIEELPLHLSGDSVPESGLENNSVPPWVLWQRNSLSISILFYRMAINRILQNQWVQLEKSYARTQAVCLSSARAIVSLVERYSAQLARHRPWATSSNLFSAAITLAVEARFSDEHTAAAYSEDINRCIAFFTSIQDQNVLASRAIEVLRQYMTEPPDPW